MIVSYITPQAELVTITDAVSIKLKEANTDGDMPVFIFEIETSVNTHYHGASLHFGVEAIQIHVNE